jgi:hypothetical protein
MFSVDSTTRFAPHVRHLPPLHNGLERNLCRDEDIEDLLPFLSPIVPLVYTHVPVNVGLSITYSRSVVPRRTAARDRRTLWHRSKVDIRVC